VDVVQEHETQEQERRNAAAQERIARGIARRGCWFPGDPD